MIYKFMTKIIDFLPIITTILAAVFTREMYMNYKKNQNKYFLWWTIGIFTFGLGTLSESINILFGWSAINFKFWYIIGALLGGFTLAQGAVYFLMSEKIGDYTTAIGIIIISIPTYIVILTPLTIPEDFKGKLTGELFEWQWVRLFSPFINIYSFVFSFGGAVYSANKYFNQIDKEARFIGNIYISAGTLLPGIGGFYSKIGYTEVLFITEFIGLFMIYKGYNIIKSNRA